MEYVGDLRSQASMVVREEGLGSISQAYILGELHGDFFNAVRVAALT
jgi:hypothetical protein